MKQLNDQACIQETEGTFPSIKQSVINRKQLTNENSWK